MSWVLRFVKTLRGEEPEYLMSSTLKLAELQQDSREIVRLVQRQHFHDQYLSLKEDKQVKCHSKLANLSPILIDDIIRAGGRIHHAPIALEVSSRVCVNSSLLPPCTGPHRPRTCVVRHPSVLWDFVRKISCASDPEQVCNLSQALRVSSAASYGWSSWRELVPYQPPFTYTGLDFFGPFFVKRSCSTTKSVWVHVCCFNSQAVHIEDVSSPETDTFIQALLRFISVRGCPKEIWSDNGMNFTGAQRELCLSIQDLNQERTKIELHSREVEW